MPASGTLMLIAVIGFMAFMAGRFLFPNCPDEPDPGDIDGGGSTGGGTDPGRPTPR